MKNFKKFVGFVLLFAFVSFNSQALTTYAINNDFKVNVCHLTSSENNPWNAIQIDNSSLPTHLGHGDFMYNGPTKDGKPDNKDKKADNWCKNNAPAQISAAKIICDSESDLPNWGAGGPNITAATVSDFLANHPNCHEQPGWKYQWGPSNATNPGNNIEHAGGSWKTFDENDLPEITPGSKVWVREEIPAGYIPFSGATTNLNSTNAKNSAEFYCDTDVLNYDNYDSISNVQAGKLYHCVAFNVKIDVCPNIQGVQVTVPENYHLNNDKQCVPDTATVYATKVVCDNEFDLPNWGNNGPDITSTTAEDFVAGNSSCKIVPWTFEWAPDGVQNPGNNVEVGGGAWTAFSNGQTQIPAGGTVWFREQLPEAYHQFSGATTDLDGTNSKRSAEFYCSTDVLNYDNFDKITPVVKDAKYYCVGFNTLKPAKADGKVHVFKYIDGVQATPEMTKTEEKPDGVSFPMYNPPYNQYPYYLGPYSDAQAGDIPYESSTYNIVGGTSYTTVEDLTTPLVGSSCSNENKPAYELQGYTYGKTFDEAKNGTPSLTAPEFVIDGDAYVIVWNKKCVPEVVIDMCKNMEGNQSEVPQGYHRDEAGNCYPDQNQCGEKTLDVVSDDSNIVDGVNATVIGSPNGAWATLSGASWIWNNLADFLGGTQQTKTFTKSFTVVGTPISASLDVAADNGFVGTINGNGAGTISDPGEFNYGATKNYDVLSFVTTGLNNLSFDVTNLAVADSDFNSNPAGLLYKLHVVSNDCPTEPTTGTLHVKKVIVGSDVNPSTFSFKLDGSETATSFESDGQNDLTVSSGTHSVVETAYQNYNATYEGCDAVNVPAGGEATCTITNTYVPVIDDSKPVCSDSSDNDGDGLTDANDPACHTDHNVNNLASYDPNGTTEVYDAPACSDGKDNDGDEAIDSNDPGCMSGPDNTWNPNDNDENNGGGGGNPGPTITSTYGGGGGSGPKGKVLGAETSCGIYIDKFLRRGYKNDEEAVKKLQKFLNDYMKSNIKVDGKFGLSTEIALKKFQKKQSGNVLNPWGFNGPTGIFYLTTQTEVNNIMCPDLKLPIPALTPIETNPLAPAKL
jgi:hypothetical protein